METTQKSGRAESEYRDTSCSPLRHPLRVRILEVTNERDISPVQFVNAGFVPDEAGYETHQQALSHVAYHFRELQKANCVEVVATHQRRGATEHVYRGCARAYFTDAEFARLTRDERRALSRTSFRGLIARVDGALLADTFDSRTDRHLTWTAMELDERGWDEFTTTLAAAFGEVEQIRHDAKARLAESGEDAVRATFGMVGFESPKLPPLAD
jgi:hypothetical protein